MALKPHLKVIADDINNICTALASKGYLAIYDTTAGAAGAGKVHVPTSTVGIGEPSGKGVAGVLLQDVVNRAVPSLQGLTGDPIGTVDANQASLNLNKNETHVSGYVRLLKVGECVTNALDASDTFANGDNLYITQLGKFSRSADSTSHQWVGRSLGIKDSDGYLKVFVNIQ